jgi:hypothetical protein
MEHQIGNEQMQQWVAALLQQQAAQAEEREQRLLAAMEEQRAAFKRQMQEMQAHSSPVPTPAPVPTGDNPTKHRMKTKIEYDDSDRTLYPPFESLLRAKLHTDGPAIGGEQEQVWYAFGCLKDKASTRMHPWVKAYQGDLTKFTVEGFIAQMQAAFADSEVKRKAQRKLGTMRQGNRDFRDFINEFDQTLLEAGAYGQDNDTKKAWLQNAISVELARVMIAVPEEETYELYCQQLHRAADQLTSLNRRTAGRALKSAPILPRPSNTSTPKSDQNTMDWEPTTNQSQRRAKWVESSELERRRREGLCLRCGRKGHRIRDCKELPAQRPDGRVNNVQEPPGDKASASEDEEAGKA